ncbi:MAG TPA: hypothetical protein VMG10_04140 [Gemmataceae bacterium]|nr:hypothetical protein [Gemmataceae bacterium]
MQQIILTDEQMKVLAEAQRQVEVRDSDGRLVGYLQFVGFTQAEIEEAKRRLASDEPRYTTAQVLAHLRSLESK